RPFLRADARGGTDGARGRAPLRTGRELRRGGEYRKDAGGRSILGRGRGLRPDSWRLRICRGIRRRTEIPRDAPLPGRADFDQPDPEFHCGACPRYAPILLTEHAMPDLDLDHLKSWIGRERTASDLITPRLAASLNAVLDIAGQTAEGEAA